MSQTTSLSESPASSQNLKYWRKSKGWTQAHLADLLKTSPPCISQWETGRQSVTKRCRVPLRDLGYRGPFVAVREAPVTYMKDDPLNDYADAVDEFRLWCKDNELNFREQMKIAMSSHMVN